MTAVLHTQRNYLHHMFQASFPYDAIWFTSQILRPFKGEFCEGRFSCWVLENCMGLDSSKSLSFRNLPLRAVSEHSSRCDGGHPLVGGYRVSLSGFLKRSLLFDVSGETLLKLQKKTSSLFH